MSSPQNFSPPEPQQKNKLPPTQALESWLAEQEALDQAEKSSAAPSQSRPKLKAAPLPPLPEVEFGDVNWVGKLTEYRQAHPPTDTTIVVEDTLEGCPQRFTCTIKIAETDSTIFGSSALGFGSKKEAKRNACMQAVKWLVANNYMPSIEEVSFRQTLSSGPKISILGAAKPKKNSSDDPTFAQQVDVLCTKLGLMPKYVIIPHKDLGSMYSGYALFEGHPKYFGKIGEFEHIFGKKHAKEHCAKDVLAFLKDIEQERMRPLSSVTNIMDGSEVAKRKIADRDSPLPSPGGSRYGIARAGKEVVDGKRLATAETVSEKQNDRDEEAEFQSAEE